jgi:hypothetical protein
VHGFMQVSELASTTHKVFPEATQKASFGNEIFSSFNVP